MTVISSVSQPIGYRVRYTHTSMSSRDDLREYTIEKCRGENIEFD